MHLNYLFKLSLRSFKTRPIRNILTVLGMGIGIGAILIFVSLGYGLQRILLSQITTPDSLLSLDVTSPDNKIYPINQKKIKEISQIQDVVEIAPLAILPGQVSIDSLTSDTLFYLCSPNFFRLGGIITKNGKLFDKDDAYEVVVSSALLKSFNIPNYQALRKEIYVTLFITKTTETTEEITVYERKKPYKIVGVIDDDTTSFIFIPLGTFKDLNIQEYNQLKVKVNNYQSLEAVKEQLTNMGFIVTSLSDTIEEANKVFRALQIILGSFGVVALSVAAIGMFNTMTVALLERTNEIGIMKAIGASNKDIEFIFLVESILIGFLGGISGIIMNYLLSYFLNTFINILAQHLGGQPINLFFTPFWLIVFTVGLSIIVGIIAGIFPAKRAAKMDPLEALRYK